MRSDRPHELAMPNDLLRNAFALTLAGYWFGTGAGFIKVGMDMEAFVDGDVVKAAAVSTFVFLGLSAVYSVANSVISFVRYRPRTGYVDLDEPNRNVEHPRKLFLPSLSNFLSLDAQSLLASQAVAVIAAIIAVRGAKPGQEFFADSAGRGIGTMVGFILGLIPVSSIMRWVNRRRGLTNEANYISKQFWLYESRHDVSFFTRLFFGAWMGYIALSVMNDSFTYPDYYDDRFLMTLLSSAFAVLSPAIFAAMRFASTVFRPPTEGEQRFKPIHWYSESRMDLPWYVRVFCAVLGAATIGEGMAKYTAKPFNKTLFYTYNVFVFTSPLLFEIARQILKRCCAAFLSERTVEDHPPLKMSYDMPWYARTGFGALNGCMLGCAVLAATANPDTFYSDPPSAIPISFAFTSAILAALSPLLMAGVDQLGFSHPILNPTDDENGDADLPWYMRMTAGMWLGALLATATSNIRQADASNIIGIYIGPSFLSLSNNVGVSTGIFIGGSVALLWPLAKLAWEAPKSAGCMNTARLRISRGTDDASGSATDNAIALGIQTHF